MWSLIRSLLLFRVGQKASRGAARMLGFGKLAMIVGIIGGIRQVRRHRHA
jgi:hypothetical protein